MGMDSEAFWLENVLIESARDYVESKGKSLGDYNMKGVFLRLDEVPTNSTFRKGMNIPENTEVITSFRTIANSEARAIVYIGTALIPKTAHVKPLNLNQRDS